MNASRNSAVTHRPGPARLSYELREASDPDLKRRRWIVGLSIAGIAIGQLVGLYQMGIIKRLPDPPRGSRAGEWFDATRVNASSYAYKRLATPDAFLMIGTYALTAILAAAGGRDRAATHRWLPIALAGKTIYDGVTTIKLGREEWQTNRRLCQYCQLATLASWASAALALPEALKALRQGRGVAGSKGALWNEPESETAPVRTTSRFRASEHRTPH